ncbi:MAG: CotH kinase family protein, partial [Methanocorpusculum sp.]|nr:CotH kinase family protein [Methanocorpusculum sp.]
ADYGNLYKPETMRMGGSMPSGGGNMPGGFNGGDMAFPGDFGNMSEMMMPDGNPDEWMRGMNIPENFGDMTGEMNPDNADRKRQGMERPQGGNMPGGFGGSSGGADLVYTDDSLSSYSAIFDNAIFSRTDTKASEKRVITALKHLKEGTDLETYIDVDKVLRYFAANTAIVSLDSYVGSTTHNYYLYENNGKLSMIPWDYNDAIGFSTDASGAVNFPIDTPVGSGIELSNRPMIGSLLAVDSYKEVYHSYLRQIAEQFLSDTARIDKIDALINEYVKNDPTAFYTYEEYQNSLPQLKKFFELRAKSILGQLDGTIPSTREGQNADKSALIPVDDLDFSALGSFSMGGRGNRGGDFMGDFAGEGFMGGFTGDRSEFMPESGFMPQTPF